MIAWEKTEDLVSTGIVHPSHPPVIETAVLADKTKKYKAGTVLKVSAGLVTVEPAAPTDDASGVLVQDSDGINAEVLVLRHGTVVRSRLLNSVGASPVAAVDGYIAKLRAGGIYAIQLFDSAKVV